MGAEYPDAFARKKREARIINAVSMDPLAKPQSRAFFRCSLTVAKPQHNAVRAEERRDIKGITLSGSGEK